MAESLSSEALEVARKYDLTQKIMPFLDRHLIFQILEFLSTKELYDSRNIMQLKLDLLRDSNMTDYTAQLWCQLNDSDEVPKEFVEQREGVLKNVDKFEESTAKVFEVLENPEVISSLKQDKIQNLQLLETNYNVTVDMINSLYQYGQFQYNCGKYQSASDILYHFRVLSTDSELIAASTWGKFASDILLLQWDSVAEELQKLRDIVDQRSFADSLTQLHHRTWIIHWSLFLFFNADNGRETLIDLYLTPSYISTIQASCPWILRYLTVAVVSKISSNSNNASNQRRLKDLIRVVGQELYEYNDPLTEFIRALYIDYDFEEAQAKLADASVILENDFFLSSTAADFLEAARHLVSELYCRIHQRIDVSQLSERLNLTKDQGEKWIANLIKDTKMDAKIDESEGTVIMNHPVTSVYQQVIESTKGLTFRSNQVLSQALNNQETVIV